MRLYVYCGIFEYVYINKNVNFFFVKVFCILNIYKSLSMKVICYLNYNIFSSKIKKKKIVMCDVKEVIWIYKVGIIDICN